MRDQEVIAAVGGFEEGGSPPRAVAIVTGREEGLREVVEGWQTALMGGFSTDPVDCLLGGITYTKWSVQGAGPFWDKSRHSSKGRGQEW